MNLTNTLRFLRASGPAGWAVCAVVVAQVAVPAVAFLDEPPTRFGFQMYSGLGAVSVDVVDARGRELDVDVEELLAGSYRPDINWTATLPDRICEVTPEAVTVTVTQPDNRRTVSCG